jgi:hypothetical protein
MPKAKDPALPSRRQYARLEPRIKTLKEGTIRKKWKKLPVDTQVKVADLLRTVGIPALTHGGNDSKNVEVQAAINELVEGYVNLITTFTTLPSAI